MDLPNVEDLCGYRNHQEFLFLAYLTLKLSYLLIDSLIAQLVKNPPALQETQVQFLGWEDSLEKG